MRHQGISLIELLISILLSGILISAASHHYLLTKRQLLKTNKILNDHMELELINELLRSSIRAAGFAPCLGLNFLSRVDRRNANNQISALLIKPNELRINRMSEDFSLVLKQLSSRQLLVRPFHSTKMPKVVLIADCQHAEIQNVEFIKKVKEGIVVNLSKPLSFNYENPIYLGEWIEERFFIKKNSSEQRAFYYQQERVDELSTLIQKMNVELDATEKNTLVNISFVLENLPTMLITTRVRAG